MKGLLFLVVALLAVPVYANDYVMLADDPVDTWAAKEEHFVSVPAPPVEPEAKRIAYSEGQVVNGYTLHDGIWWKGGIGYVPRKTIDGWTYDKYTPMIQATSTRMLPMRSGRLRGLFGACFGGS